ncbi:YbhB/YbcL family Raf kinase inhibitor-like protein [Acuticoccus sp.]|uniref:YbhB/YbcL family Raf kinase inhibitor-like protein n=1 Tax=Acuticoccus sp. TaxID=1904378 RepID=UPI003B51D6AF
MLRTAAILLGSVSLCATAAAQQAADLPAKLPPTHEQLDDPRSANVTVVGHVLEPVQLEPTRERIDRLSKPAGFEVEVFAQDLVNPRMIAVADDGTLYVTRRSVGDVLMLRDTDGDGRADERQVVASRPMMHGIDVDGTDVYLTTVAEVYRTKRRADGSLEPLTRIIDDLPAGGQHPNRTVVMGPDGKLYISVGSTCNACGETDPENATMVRAEPDGSSRTIFASGLRNTIGYAFEPSTGELWGMDHGIDWLGDNEQHEELNHIVAGAKYGWPYIYGDGKFNPQDAPPNGITMEEWAAESAEPVGLYVPHSAPMQLTFYTGDAFPEEYRGDAYIAMRGSWNRKPPSGYEVLRIDFEDGRPVGFEPFITGFLMEDEASPTGWGQMGRIAGLAEGPDGALYLSDDTNGVIYRIAYAGDGEPGTASLRPTNEAGASVRMTMADPPEKPAAKVGELAKDIVTPSGGPIEVTSTAFEDGAPIPDTHAAEGDNISPPLDWGAGPDGTASYVVLMEDPDVANDAPFVHWVAYNIPADVTELVEGVPGTPKVAEPEGMLQGANDRGSTGYYGMRPPIGDPAHAYHIMVFALDTMLDLPHGASRQEVVDAMEGHVLSVGEVVGTYERTEVAAN